MAMMRSQVTAVGIGSDGVLYLPLVGVASNEGDPMKAATWLGEEVVSLKSFLAHPSKYLRGIVRVVDRKARSVGVFLDADALDELVEDLEASSPAFLESLDASRRSGRVPGAIVKKRLGLG